MKVTLHCYKDGAMVEAVDVSSKQAHFLGRNSDMSDVLLAHESISRCHAVIGQDDTGKAWVRRRCCAWLPWLGECRAATAVAPCASPCSIACMSCASVADGFGLVARHVFERREGDAEQATRAAERCARAADARAPSASFHSAVLLSACRRRRAAVRCVHTRVQGAHRWQAAHCRRARACGAHSRCWHSNSANSPHVLQCSGWRRRGQ